METAKLERLVSKLLREGAVCKEDGVQPLSAFSQSQPSVIASSQNSPIGVWRANLSCLRRF